MTTILVRHKVNDFAKWISSYNTLDSFHKSGGVKSSRIYKSSDNPNEVVVLTEFADVATARRFAQSEGLKSAMQNAGVADKPDIYFLDEFGTRSFG